MAFKMRKSPMQRNFGVGSPAKGLVRGIGPHNPAHKAVGDDSDAAHNLEEFKKLDPPKPKPKNPFEQETSPLESGFIDDLKEGFTKVKKTIKNIPKNIKKKYKEYEDKELVRQMNAGKTGTSR